MNGPDKTLGMPDGPTNTKSVAAISDAEFIRGVEVLGSDRQRWTDAMIAFADNRHSGVDTTVRHALRDATALSRALDAAPTYDATRITALTARIAAAAHVTPRLTVPASRPAQRLEIANVSQAHFMQAHFTQAAVSQTSQHAILTAQADLRPGTRSQPKATISPRQTRALWSSIAVLAASLFMGVFVGQSDISNTTLPSLVEMAGLSIDNAGHHLGHVDAWDQD
jgi:hypothetical protein